MQYNVGKLYPAGCLVTQHVCEALYQKQGCVSMFLLCILMLRFGLRQVYFYIKVLLYALLSTRTCGCRS